MIRLVFTLIGITLFYSAAESQKKKYWVFFHEEGSNCEVRELMGEHSTIKNESVAEKVALLSARGFRFERTSKWFGAASSYLSDEQLAEIKRMSFVHSVEPVRTLKTEQQYKFRGDFDSGLNQINGKQLIDNGLTGRDVKIGIIDGGFGGILADPELAHLAREGHLIEIKDFSGRGHDKQHILSNDSSISHGRDVLKYLAGVRNGVPQGLATKSKFYLAITEVNEIESRIEEDNWIAAIEWMDSLGIRLINSSLGYSSDYDNPSENYFPKNMDGNTATISKAAKIATEQKGMIILAPAGNEGDYPGWGVITAPGDVQGVITVAATDKQFAKPPFSGKGLETNSFTKPDVACYTDGGTSFSTPVICGLVACMLEKKPSLTRTEIFSILQRSSHLYPYKNNYLGYGIPDCKKVLQFLNGVEVATANQTIESKRDVFKLKHMALIGKDIVLFHKRDESTVIKQELINQGAVKIERYQGAERTTISTSSGVFEIIWPKSK